LDLRKPEQSGAVRSTKRLERFPLQLVRALHNLAEVRRGAYGVETRVVHERRRRVKSTVNRAFQQPERSVMISRLGERPRPMVEGLGIAKAGLDRLIGLANHLIVSPLERRDHVTEQGAALARWPFGATRSLQAYDRVARVLRLS